MPLEPLAPLGSLFGAAPAPAPADPRDAAARLKQALPPLTPEEEDSLLARVGNKALGGMAYVGGLLDKFTGGRAVRGLLGGKPRELLSLLPGSDDLFHLTSEEDRVSGRDLTDQWGLTEKGQEGFLPTLAGLGTEVLTNPTTYLTFGAGAATEAGQAASKIGALPRTLAGRIKGFASPEELTAAFPEAVRKAGEVGLDVGQVLNKPLGGAVGLKLPFMKPFATLGTGEGTLAALDAAGRGASWADAALRATPYLGRAYEAGAGALDATRRYGRALFDSRVQGATSAPGQALGEQLTEGLGRELAKVKGGAAGTIRAADELGVLPETTLLRQVGEGITPEGVAADKLAAAQDVTGRLRAAHAEADAVGESLGFGRPELRDEYVEHLARQGARPSVPTRGAGGAGDPMRSGVLGGREELYKNVPGGTQALNEMSTDPEIWGINARYGPRSSVEGGTAPTALPQRADYILRKHLQVSPEEAASLPDVVKLAREGGQLSERQAQLLALQKKSQDLAEWAAQGDPARLAGEGRAAQPLFPNNPILDTYASVAGKVRRNEAGKAIHDLFASEARHATEAGPGWVNVKDAYTKAGFSEPEQALREFGRRRDLLGPQVDAARRFSHGELPQAASALEQWVPPEIARDAERFVKSFQVPETLKPLVGAVDYLTQLNKTFQTAVFPGFHVRNFTSGQFANWMMGGTDPRFAGTPLAVIKPVTDAQALLRGKVVPDATQIPFLAKLAGEGGLDEAAATRQLQDLAYQYGVVGQGAGMGVRAEAEAGAQALALKQAIPGMEPFPGYLEAARGAIPRSGAELNPLNVAGVNATTDVNSLVRAGRQVGEATEDTNRLSGWMGLLRQGYHPEDAARLTRAAHVDYSALTGFERQVMRRVVPFYTYTRGIVPFVLESLAKDPGGLAGQTAMAGYSLRQGNQNFVPEYLSSGLALPVGGEKEGTQRYLTKLDTPVEAAFEAVRGGGPAESLLGLLGQTNPLLKGPLEYATGKQFYSGRDVESLRPITGNELVDQALMNSPASRLVTTGRTLLDPRKWADPGALATNLATGARLSDVDVARQRDLAAREYISKALAGKEGVGRYETIYPRADALQALTPRDLELLRLNAALEDKARKEARARRAAAP